MREHTPLHDASGLLIGEVTSGLLAPSADRAIAMGYLPPAHASIGTVVQAMVRGRAVPMQVCALPFVAHRYVRA